MSLLNGLKNDYSKFQDFFLPQKLDNKNILNSFDFYLVRPSSTGYTNISGSTNSLMWKRSFEVIGTPYDFDIYPAAYSNNLFGEQTYIFNFNLDVDISNYYDYFNFQVTDLFL